MYITRLSLVAGAVALASVSVAQVVVPNAYAGLSSGGNGLNTLIRDNGNARTAQFVISSSQLASINVGASITGMAFRLYNGNTTGFPATTATWADYTINVGVGVAPSAASTTFANNFTSAPTTVRSGSLVVNALSYTAGATGTTPNPFGPTITFNTPYLYTGGNLTIEVRHTGSDIVNGATDFLDALPAATAGYGTDFWAATATGNTATVGAANSFTITRLTVAPVPEPASMAVLALGALALLRRRRNK
jgi:hypothetical protein